MVRLTLRLVSTRAMETYILVSIIIIIIVVVIIEKMAAWSSKLDRETNSRNAIDRIRSAARDPQTTRLVIALREDLKDFRPSSVIAEKFTLLNASPETALRIYAAALTCPDRILNFIGIRGLLTLKRYEGIGPLLQSLEDARIREYFLNEVLDTITELAVYSPVNGKNGFAATLIEMMTNKQLDPDTVISRVDTLVQISARSPGQYNDNDFNYILSIICNHANQLLNSDNPVVQARGESYMKIIRSAQQTRLAYQATSANSMSRLSVHQSNLPCPERVDYYDILQVTPNAETEVISGAYQKLAKKYHPDVHEDLQAKLKMQQLNEAFEILGNAEKRKKYDRSRRH